MYNYQSIDSITVSGCNLKSFIIVLPNGPDKTVTDVWTDFRKNVTIMEFND